MINADKLSGKWNEIRGQVKQKWAKLTDNDLTFANGNIDQLIGTIQRKTGEAREEIENFLNETMDKGASILQQAKDAVQNTASHVTESVRKGYQKAQESMHDGYESVTDKIEEGEEQFDEFVQNRPKQSVLIALGLGMVAGAGVAMFLANRSRACNTPRAISKDAKHFWESLVDSLPESVSSRFRS
jgi:uncharacterized protein YjbJ (UPF0337 family)